VVLAAGLGRRYPGKLATPLDGRPLVAHVLDVADAAVRAGDLDRVLVVVGVGTAAARDAETVRAVVSSHAFDIVENDDPAAGLSRSVQVALTALGSTPVDGALMMLGDQPRVSLDVVRDILAIWRANRPSFVTPRYEVGGSGNPVLLDRSAWPLAARLEGDIGMAAVTRMHPELVTYVDVHGANPDVDTPEDLAALG